MRCIRFSVGAVVVITCGLMAGSANGGRLPQEIIGPYRAAIERIRQAYTHATIEGTIAVSFPTQDKSYEQKFVMRASGQFRRLDVTTVRQRRAGLQKGATQMSMATPNGSLNSFTQPDHKFFDDAQETGYDKTVAQIDGGCLLNLTYSLGGTGTALDTLTSTNVKITAVKKMTVDGEKLVQIEFDETGKYAGQTGLWKSTLLLSPTNGWALRGFTRTLGQGSTQIAQRAKLTYSDVQDGVPLVQSVEYETVEGSRQQPIKREAVQLTDFDLGDPDDSFFTSFQF